MIKILVDTTADYTMEEIRERSFELVPLHITIGGKDYRDCYDLNKEQFFELLVTNEEFPKTSQPSPQDFVDVFEQAKEAGDEVICILISSKLSGTIQSAMLAKDMAEYDGIHVVDSLGGACMNRILADYAAQRAKEGAAAKTIVAELEELRNRVKILAVVDTLEYLCKGGRLSRTAAVIGEMARVKPIVTVRDGEIAVAGKCLGKNKAVSTMLKMIGEYEIDPAFPMYPLYSYGTENCEVFEERLQSADYKTEERIQIGATVGTHIGPGAYGVAFVAK